MKAFLLLAIGGAILSSVPSLFAVTVSIDTTAVGSSSLTTTTVPITVSGANSDRLLIIMTASELNNAHTINSASWSLGGSFTKLADVNSPGVGSTTKATLWYLANPVAGAGTVSVSSSLTGGVHAHVFSLYDAVIPTTFETFTASSATSASAFFPSVSAGALIVDIYAGNDGADPYMATGTGHVLEETLVAISVESASGSRSVGTAGPVTLGIDANSPNPNPTRTAYIAAVIEAAPPIPEPSRALLLALSLGAVALRRRR